MLPYIIVGVILGLPVFFGIFFRVSASHLFFSVMTGELLGRYFGDDIEHFISQTFTNSNLTQYAHAIVITLPVILTALFLKGSVSKSKSILNLFPLVITSVVYGAFILPVLPPDVQALAVTVPFGKDLLDTSNAIIGGVVLVQLVALWLLNRGDRSSGKKSRKRG